MQRRLSTIYFQFCIRILAFLFAFFIGRQLLGSDFTPFFRWWISLLAITVTFYPTMGILFARFHDGGWIFSKMIGLALGGYFIWLLSSLQLMKFTRSNTIITLFICLLINVGIVTGYYYWKKHNGSGKESLNKLYQFDIDKLKSILTVEVMFFTVFLFWTYCRGFRPEVSNTESPMDYGFMMALMRTDYMPPEDIWMSGKYINYYYVGQYMATYLTKLSQTRVNEGYNLALMTIAGGTFTLSYSLIYNVMKNFIADQSMRKRKTSEYAFTLITGKVSSFWCVLAGLLASFSITFAATMHYPIKKFIQPLWYRIFNLEIPKAVAPKIGDSFWFPSSTRFIGYDPEVAHDKTIHEFPSYSFILGDLHAHVINIIFVLSVLGLLYAFLLYRKERMDDLRLGLSIPKQNLLKEGFHPFILLFGFFIGLFHMTNYWDFPIYVVVCGAIILFSNAVLYQFSMDTIKLTAIHAAVVLGQGELIALPFTIKFDQISSRICLAVAHTPLYQLAIVWGLPVFLVAFFVITRYRDLRKEGYITYKNKQYYINKAKKQQLPRIVSDRVDFSGEKNKLYQFIEHLQISDLFIVTIGLCAIGLILLPEIIYVDDIYGDYKRANTMFKLTYQSFIMFGLCMGYIVVRFLRFGRTVTRKVVAIISFVLLLWTMHYSVTAMKSWYQDITKTQNYKGLDSVNFLKKTNMDDYEVIEWLNANVDGTPVVLEADGVSYFDGTRIYERISAFTGLPTIAGWETHEWLWRSGALGGYPAILKERKQDIKTIYTSSDRNEILYYLKKYNVSYIYLGNMEQTAYGSENFSLLKELGDIIYYSPETLTKAYESTLVRIDQSLYNSVQPVDESLNDN